MKTVYIALLVAVLGNILILMLAGCANPQPPMKGVDEALGPVNMWSSEVGRLGIQSQMSYTSTGVDLWPNSTSEFMTRDSLSELTIHRTNGGVENMERLNISAMVDQTENGAYRVGVERSGIGQFRDIWFCFENVTPTVAVCPFKITLNGVFVNEDGKWQQVHGGSCDEHR